MLTTKQTIAQWPFERLYVAPFTQRRGFDERSLTYKMVPIEQARQLTGIRVLDMVVDGLIASALRTKAPGHRSYTDPKLSATIHKLTGLCPPSAAPSAAGGASRRSTSASSPATAATSASTHCNPSRQQIKHIGLTIVGPICFMIIYNLTIKIYVSQREKAVDRSSSR